MKIFGFQFNNPSNIEKLFFLLKGPLKFEFFQLRAKHLWDFLVVSLNLIILYTIWKNLLNSIKVIEGQKHFLVIFILHILFPPHFNKIITEIQIFESGHIHMAQEFQWLNVIIPKFHFLYLCELNVQEMTNNSLWVGLYWIRKIWLMTMFVTFHYFRNWRKCFFYPQRVYAWLESSYYLIRTSKNLLFVSVSFTNSHHRQFVINFSLKITCIIFVAL